MQSLQFPYQTAIYHGKVRDVYTIGTNWLIMVASDRISAFDVILPKTIPYKGQVLNQIAEFMLGQTQDICPNWLLDAPAPNVSVGKKCTPFKIEMVVRGNLVGHAYRTYASGSRTLCGVSLPEGLKENDWDKVASAICNCDCSNFKRLYKIEERLMYLASEKGNAKVILNRINEIKEAK